MNKENNLKDSTSLKKQIDLIFNSSDFKDDLCLKKYNESDCSFVDDYIYHIIQKHLNLKNFELVSSFEPFEDFDDKGHFYSTIKGKIDEQPVYLDLTAYYDFHDIGYELGVSCLDIKLGKDFEATIDNLVQKAIENREFATKLRLMEKL